MKGTIYFANRPDEGVLKHIGFAKAGIFVTRSNLYICVDDSYYEYVKESDCFVACPDIRKIEMEDES